MNESNIQRVARIAGDLLVHPKHLPKYLRYAPFNGHQPVDIGLPWYSFSAIDFLDRYVTKEMTVFEYGGGGSTIFYARRAKRVICVESSHDWADKIEQVIKEQKITNTTVLRHPFDISDKPAFEKSTYLNCVRDYDVDVYAIDGYEEDVQLRPICFGLVEKIIGEGIVVLDDSWRYEPLRKNNKSKEVRVFQSLGPCRYGVTSTDVFFY